MAAREPEPPAVDSTEAGPLGAKRAAESERRAVGADPKVLARALRDTARAVFEAQVGDLRQGKSVDFDTYMSQSRRLLEAELGVAAGRAERLTALEGHFSRLRALEERIEQGVRSGVHAYTRVDYWSARGERLFAEWRLAQALGGTGNLLPATPPDPFGDSGPLLARAGARDTFEATRANPQALVREAVDAAYHELKLLEESGAAGRYVIFQPIVQPSRRRVEVERAAGAGPPDLLPALEAHWGLAWFEELVIKSRVEAGVKRFAAEDYFRAVADRLEAEVWLANARSGRARPLPLTGGLQDRFGTVYDPLDTRDLARAKFEAARADPLQLNVKRREALLRAYTLSTDAMRQGKEAFADFISEQSRKLLAVELDLAGGRAERLAALQRYWTRARDLEERVQSRVEAGVRLYRHADYLDARCDRIRAELWLAEARAGKE
jgi:hypothetical protein